MNRCLSIPTACCAIAMVASLLLCGGCGSLSKPYPEKSLYAIDLGELPAPEKSQETRVLRVDDVHVAKPFDGLAFVYQVSNSQFTTDYYNGFITSPDRIFSGALVDWLARSGLYSSVINGDSSADYQLTLETNVTQLYGDYSATGAPAAVIEAKFFLIDQTGGNYNIIFQKAYRHSEPMSAASPTELIRGWGKGYRNILTSLSEDLRATTTPRRSVALP